MKAKDFNFGDIVYHRSVYEHGEPLKVIGIMENKLLLEGDYSGGTHGMIQSDWLPIAGVSRIRNYAYKKESRDAAKNATKFITNMKYSNSPELDIMKEFVNRVMKLTSDVEYNPEYE